MALRFGLLIALFWGVLTFTGHAQEVPPMGITRVPVSLYPTPERGLLIIGELPQRSAVLIDGRDPIGLWLLVQSLEGNQRGWIAAGYMMLSLDVNLYDLPIREDQLATLPAPTPSYSPEVSAKLDRLFAYPLLYQMDTDAMRATFERGVALGNRPQVFVKIGDSNTANGDFLRPIGMNLRRPVCDYGAYSYLTETVAYFSVSPREPFTNSFDSTHFTVRDGLGTNGLLDPIWATDPACGANESLLECEYRVVRPSIAIMLIGLMDLEHHTIDFFRANLAFIVERSLELGVIPVLTTYAVLTDYPTAQDSLWEKSLDLNLAILDVVDQYDVPLIHLWRAQQTLPNVGIGPDRTHLKHSVGDFCRFTGEEWLYGGTMRNLLTLQALDEIRRGVLNLPVSP